MNPLRFLAPAGVGIAVLLTSQAVAATNSLPLSTALGLGTSNTRGFVVRTVQAPPGVAVENTLARALSQLNGTLGGPNGNLLPNDAVPGPLGGGAYPVDTVNFEVDGNPFDLVDSNGNTLASFAPTLFPGIPGFNNSRDGFAVEVVGFVQLPAGITTFGVSVGTDRTDLKDDDSYVVYVGRNPRDAFNLKIGEFERFAPPLLDHSKNENPFSVDALIFGRYEPQMFLQPQATQVIPREPQAQSEAEVTIRILD